MDNSKQPAFGYAMCTADGQSHIEQQGLTKREYFAGLAMQGIMANPNASHQRNGEAMTHSVLVKESLLIADELLKQLEQ